MLEAYTEDPCSDLQLYLQTLFSSICRLQQLTIIQNKKAWLIHLDVIILSAEGGNLYDAVTTTARAALWDLKIPKTRGIGYNPPSAIEEEEIERDVEMIGFNALLKSKKGKGSADVDFELESYWDEGEPLEDRELLPVSITLNIVSLSSIHLDWM